MPKCCAPTISPIMAEFTRKICDMLKMVYWYSDMYMRASALWHKK